MSTDKYFKYAVEKIGFFLFGMRKFNQGDAFYVRTYVRTQYV